MLTSRYSAGESTRVMMTRAEWIDAFSSTGVQENNDIYNRQNINKLRWAIVSILTIGLLEIRWLIHKVKLYLEKIILF